MTDHRAVPDEVLTDVEQVIRQVNKVLKKKLFVVAGPSGVGKNTIIKKLLANHPYEMSRVRTYTTRARREGEGDDQYRFVDTEEFKRLACAGRLLEADSENPLGHDVYGLGKSYSMPADIYEGMGDNQHIVVAEVDVVGAERLKARYPDCVTVFVMAPPHDLIQRIRERPDKTMDSEALEKRMETAKAQFRAANEFDYVIFNREGCLDDTVMLVGSIIQVERMRVQKGFNLEAILTPEAIAAASADLEQGG